MTKPHASLSCLTMARLRSCPMPYLTIEIAFEFIRPFLHLGKRFLVVQPTLPKFKNLDRVDIGSTRGAMENI